MAKTEELSAEQIRSEILRHLSDGPKTGAKLRELIFPNTDDKYGYGAITYNAKQLVAARRIKRMDKNNRLSPYALRAGTEAPAPEVHDIPAAPKRKYERKGTNGKAEGTGTIAVGKYLVKRIQADLTELANLLGE